MWLAKLSFVMLLVRWFDEMFNGPFQTVVATNTALKAYYNILTSSSVYFFGFGNMMLFAEPCEQYYTIFVQTVIFKYITHPIRP